MIVAISKLTRNAPVLFGGEINNHLSVDWASLIFTA
jgi:hypothetical protein